MLVANLNIWRVRFDSRFESSSGMERYTIEHKDCTGLVATVGDSLEDVRAAITCHLGAQSRLGELKEAHFLGKTI